MKNLAHCYTQQALILSYDNDDDDDKQLYFLFTIGSKTKDFSMAFYLLWSFH